MREKMRKRRFGFTLVEILVAAGVLSIFFVGVFNIYRSGSNVFRSGNWRMVTQKKLQLALQQIREDIERANGATSFLADSVASEPLPLYLSKDCTVAGAEPTLLIGITSPKMLMYGSITTPNTEVSTIATTRVKGTWMGFALYCGANGFLRYVRKNDPDTEPPPVGDNITNYKPSSGVGPSASFTQAVSDPAHKMMDNNEFVDGVTQIGFAYQVGDRNAVTILVECSSSTPGQPVSTVREQVVAKLLTGTNVILFP